MIMWGSYTRGGLYLECTLPHVPKSWETEDTWFLSLMRESLHVGFTDTCT